MSEITTAAELADYPPGSTFTARSGEVWMLERVHTMGSTNDLCAHLASPETPHASSTDVLRKWGPLTPQWRPDRPAQPTVQPSAESVARALFLQRYPGSGGWDGPGWEKRRGPWLKAAEAVLALIGGRTEQEVIDSFLNRLGEAVAQFSGDQRLTALAAAIRGEQ